MGGFGNESLDASHSSIHHVDGDFTDSLVTKLLTELLHADSLVGDLVGQDGFQILKRSGATLETLFVDYRLRCNIGWLRQ